jgi:dihydroxy-acid dehydratase
MELLAKNIRPRDIVTLRSLENAATVIAASGGSTNGGLHLPAIAHEAGIDFDLQDVCEIFRRTPYIADLKPAGQYVMRDLHDAGGVPMLMRALLDGGYLHGDCITVTGKTIAENLADVRFNPEQVVIRTTDAPLSPVGGRYTSILKPLISVMYKDRAVSSRM